MKDDTKKIEVGDSWQKDSIGVVVFGYTSDSCGFVVFRVGMTGVGWLGGYQVQTEHVFRRDYTFSYADPDRKESKLQKIKRKYNQAVAKLTIE